MQTTQATAGSGSSDRRAAAIFDLDRTLLIGASGPILSEALRRAGVVSGSTQGIESVMFKVFDLIGETYPSMLVSRQGARVARGWPVDAVREAARSAAEPLADAVLPYARQLIDEHRAAGRLLVMATTTPADLIRPLAERLGFDDVVATRYGIEDGRYDGTIDGEFVWGRGKARAVSQWVLDNDVDLLASYAYSDSWYDTPLLSIVGHPTVVNPDPRMLGMATVRRWPVVHFDVPAGVPKFVGIEPQQVLFMLAQPQLFPWVRFDLGGSTTSRPRVPPSWWGTIAPTWTRWPSASPSPVGDDRCASSARRRSSTLRSSARSPRRSGASASIVAPARTPRCRPPRRPSPPVSWWL